MTRRFTSSFQGRLELGEFVHSDTGICAYIPRVDRSLPAPKAQESLLGMEGIIRISIQKSYPCAQVIRKRFVDDFPLEGMRGNEYALWATWPHACESLPSYEDIRKEFDIWSMGNVPFFSRGFSRSKGVFNIHGNGYSKRSGSFVSNLKNAFRKNVGARFVLLEEGADFEKVLGSIESSGYKPIEIDPINDY